MSKSSLEGTLESFGERTERMFSNTGAARPSSESERSDMSSNDKSSLGSDSSLGRWKLMDDIGGSLPSLALVTVVGLWPGEEPVRERLLGGNLLLELDTLHFSLSSVLNLDGAGGGGGSFLSMTVSNKESKSWFLSGTLMSMSRVPSSPRSSSG